MMKFYGTMICQDCLRAREALPAAGVPFDFVDITASVGNLREFMRLRDGNVAFDEARAAGHIGIPCFLKDDGTVIVGMEQFLTDKQA